MSNKLFRKKWALAYRVALFAWLLLILIGTVIPGKSVPLKHITFSDKAAHFIQYLIFSIILFRLNKTIGVDSKKTLQLLIILAVPLSILTEVVQIWIPNRDFSYLDILANFIGFLVVIIYIIIKETVVAAKRRQNESDQQ